MRRYWAKLVVGLCTYSVAFSKDLQTERAAPAYVIHLAPRTLQLRVTHGSLPWGIRLAQEESREDMLIPGVHQ